MFHLFYNLIGIAKLFQYPLRFCGSRQLVVSCPKFDPADIMKPG